MFRRSFALTATLAIVLVGLVPTAASAVTCSDQNHSAYGGGDGSSATPFLISSVAHLETLRDRVNADVAGSEQDRCYFLQTADLDLGGIASWEPIGTDTSSGDRTKFLGYYDGGSYRIQNLTIAGQTDAIRHYGLFGYARHGLIENVRLTDVDIDLSFAGKSSSRYVGGLVGFLDSSSSSGVPDTRLERVSVQGTVEVDYSGGGDAYVGGVVGRGGEHGRIDDRIAFVGDVSGVFATTDSGDQGNYGGLVGRSSWDSSISLGYSAANVTVTRGTGNVGDIYAGVLVGTSSTNPSVLEELYAVGSARVLGTGSGTGYAGAIGFIGDELDEFRDIYWLDSIGNFTGGAHPDFPTGAGGLFNVASRTDAQMRLAQPATTMTTATPGSGRWVYNNAPGNNDPNGKWYLVLSPSAGTYPYPVFFWEADPATVPAGTSIIDQQFGWTPVVVSTPVASPAGPSLACTPQDPPVGSTVTCDITRGDADIDILWRATAGDAVIGSTGVRLGSDGTGTFSFVVPRSALGLRIGVELVEWTGPLDVGIAGGPLPQSVPAGQGTPVPAAVVLLLGVLGLAMLGSGLLMRRARWAR